MSVRAEHFAITILYAIQNVPSFTDRQIVKRLLHYQCFNAYFTALTLKHFMPLGHVQ